jgi:hypothetical protein
MWVNPGSGIGTDPGCESLHCAAEQHSSARIRRRPIGPQRRPRSRRLAEGLHLVEEEDRSGPTRTGHLTNLDDQGREVALGIATVSGALGDV